MNVMALLHDAVFMNAGSYVMSPNSSGDVLICRRSIARTSVSPRTPPCSTFTGYTLPVRESFTSSDPTSFRSPAGGGAVDAFAGPDAGEVEEAEEVEEERPEGAVFVSLIANVL